MKKELTMENRESTSFIIKARFRSFRYAFRGLNAFFAGQHNAFIHLLMTIAAFIAAIFFSISKTEVIAIIIAAGFVWAAELFNTAIEKLADLVSKDFHPGIKFVKDVSAAAVLLSALAAFLTGAIIFLPKLLS
ncbi:MAG: diacylglycerol kinase family protein [Chitinophagales bacterium]